MAPRYKVWVEIERIDEGEAPNRQYLKCAEPVDVAVFDTIEEAIAEVERLSDGESPGYWDKDGLPYDLDSTAAPIRSYRSDKIEARGGF